MSAHLDALVRELADAVKGDPDDLPVRLRKAVVFAQSPLTVKIGGSDVAVPVQATGPIPANGTVCWVLESGPRRILLTASGVRSTGGDTITASAASVIPLVVKGAASQTADLLRAQDGTGSSVVSITPLGQTISQFGAFGQGAASNFGPGNEVNLASQAPTATSRPLVVRGAASQTANLVEVQTDTGEVRTRIASNGSLRVTGGSNPQGVDGGAWLTVATGGPGDKGLVVRGVASQTANLAEFQNSAGTVLASISAEGHVASFLPGLGFRRLEVGAVDSGGAGHRIVRVAN